MVCVSFEFCIRGVNRDDYADIAGLCCQLGYPATPRQIELRIAHILALDNHKVFVAEATGGNVIGWVHVHSYPLIESDLMAEIGGLVVNRDFRRKGVGRALVKHAEEWAKAAGCANVSVRSNVIRQESHAFYEGVGYTRVKAQYTYRKQFWGSERGSE